MTQNTFLALCMSALIAFGPGVALVAAPAGDPLSVTGCLLLSRRAGVFALHMEYNRIAVMGHGDLPSHVGHLVTLTGTFEAQDGLLRFMVDEIVDLSPTCETQA